MFPGCQGTTAVNLLAAKALIFKLAQEPVFKEIQQKTLDNAVVMAKSFTQRGYRIVSGGTDNHQVLIDLRSKELTGKVAENCLETAGIVVNRNVVPEDAQSPGKVSGIRLGTGALSARAMAAPQIEKVVELMDLVMMNPTNKVILKDVSAEVLKLCREFPVHKSA